MAERTIVQRGAKFDDSSVKNKWKWTWMEVEMEEVKERLGKHLRKIARPGHAVCVLCNCELNYGSKGRIALEHHLKTAVHKKAAKSLEGNFSITGQPLCETTVYGAHPMFAEKSLPKEDTRLTPLVALEDRTQNAEAMVVSFVAENNMSLAAVPRLVQLAKALAEDKPALDNMASSNATASYKLRFGVAATFQEELVGELRVTPFSLNIDEAMNSNNEKVVTVLVSHFSEKHQAVVVNHLTSFSLTRITSENLFQQLDALFVQLQLPWENLLSVMMDSCRVMRGEKSGLESLIRERRAPHLLDVDGDTCHHAHNAAKAFCVPFARHIENLLSDLNTDHKWSTYNKELFQKICLTLDILPSAPMKYVPHRWLSLVEVVADTLRLMDALVVFYYSFLSMSDQALYKDVLDQILSDRGIQDATRQAIMKVQAEAKATLKSSTKDGKERKQRIAEKLFIHRDKTLLQLHFYMTVLSILHKYIKVFQTKQPMMHELHSRQEELLKEYLQCFVRPEKLEGGPCRLCKLDLEDAAIILPVELIVLGRYAEQHLQRRKKGDSVKAEFLQQAKKAYIVGGTKLIDKMPLTNKVLRCFSCLDPSMRGTTTALRELKKLPSLIPGHIMQDDQEAFDAEVRAFLTDRNIPAMAAEERIDNWWAQVDGKRYPTLKTAVKAVLSCFHGPIVESSFSVMGEVIDKSTTNMDMETYSAIQTVKNGLAASGETAVEFFRKKDPLRDPVNAVLMRNMLSAAKKDKERMHKNRENNKKAAESLGVQPKKLSTKRKAIEEVFDSAKRARLHRHAENSNRNNGQVLKESNITDVRADDDTNRAKQKKTAEGDADHKKTKQSSLARFFTSATRP